MAGIQEWIFILVLVLVVFVIFGAGRIAEIGTALGRAISGFRRAVKEDKDEAKDQVDKAADEEKKVD